MAYNFTKLTEVAMTENIDDSVNLLIEQGDDIKRMSLGNIPQRAQADWNETNEASPAFILNKPDISSGGGNASITYFLISGTSVVDENKIKVTKAAMLEALNSGIVKLKWAIGAESETTVLSYAVPASGSPAVYFINSQGAITSCTTNA